MRKSASLEFYCLIHLLIKCGNLANMQNFKMERNQDRSFTQRSPNMAPLHQHRIQQRFWIAIEEEISFEFVVLSLSYLLENLLEAGATSGLHLLYYQAHNWVHQIETLKFESPLPSQ